MRALRLVKDWRVPGLVEYHLLGEDETLPQVPPRILRSVAFLYTEHGSKPQGTVFFTSVSDQDPKPSGGREFVYAVTAAHVIKGMHKARVRLNVRGSAPQFVSSRISDWRFHPTSDVAAISMELPADADHTAWPARIHLLDDITTMFGLGPGDDVYMVGLFAQRPGDEQNIPIVRTGSIAAMLGEPIISKYGTFPAYLIETRSTPGMSGCPVFILATTTMRRDFEHPANAKQPYLWGHYLLGVGHGHYKQGHGRPSPKGYTEHLNVGISLVTPADKILELINSPKEQEMRKRKAERENRSDAAANIVADRSTPQAGITAKEFAETLRKVSRPLKKPSAPGRAKKGT